MAHTSGDFMDAERDSTGRIILHLEGLFRKAYECSAYVLCPQMHPLKTTKSYLKIIGAKMASAGFLHSGDVTAVRQATPP